MRHLFAIPFITFGLVIACEGPASAICVHGYAFCTTCSRSYTQTQGALYAPAASPFAAPAYPGYASPASAVYAYHGTSVPAYQPYSYSSYATPAYYGYASPVHSPYAAQSASRPVAPSSYLTGFDPSAPAAPVSPGTVLSTGQLFGSHILQNLKKFGAGLSQSGLLQLAEQLFVDAAGFAPNPVDKGILTTISNVVAGVPGGTVTPDPGTSPATPSSGSSNVLRITVTIELPPGVKAQVSQSGNTTTQTNSTPPNTTPAGSTPASTGTIVGGPNPAGNSGPPLAPTPGTPTVPAPRPKP